MTKMQQQKQYVLVSNWPVYRFQGRMWSRRLWVKDLELHLKYLKCITLLCPVNEGCPPESFVSLSTEIADRISLEAIPEFLGRKDRILGVPYFLYKVISILSRAEIIHYTIAEHPFLWGWIIPVIRKFTRIKIVAMVESSFWRIDRVPYVGKILARINEFMAKAAVTNSQVAFVTQHEYIQSLTNSRNSNHVIAPVWTDENVYVKNDELDELLLNRQEQLHSGLMIGFFGQLRPEKGPELLVDAAKYMSAKGRDFRVDIYGQGPSLESLKQQAEGIKGVNFCGFLTYGESFFKTLRNYHVVVVANRADELPRIVFDAFSQAVPVVASTTPGLEIVCHKENGMKFHRGDSDSLAQNLIEVANDRELLMQLSRNALRDAREYSHEGMHRKRAEVLNRCFPESEVVYAFT